MPHFYRYPLDIIWETNYLIYIITSFLRSVRTTGSFLGPSALPSSAKNLDHYIVYYVCRHTCPSSSNNQRTHQIQYDKEIYISKPHQTRPDQTTGDHVTKRPVSHSDFSTLYPWSFPSQHLADLSRPNKHTFKLKPLLIFQSML